MTVSKGPGAHIAIRTYLSTGIRLAFSPGVRDESKLAMGGEEFIETLPPDLKAGARPFVFFDKEALADSYFRLFDELYEAYNNTETRILLAPCWAHGASEAFLRRVRAKADERGGVMIHMHLLQSPVHKAYGLRRHGKPTVLWLDDLGLVERNVVYGHAIHDSRFTHYEMRTWPTPEPLTVEAGCLGAVAGVRRPCANPNILAIKRPSTRERLAKREVSGDQSGRRHAF